MSGRLAKAAIISYGVIGLAFQVRLSLDWVAAVRSGRKSRRGARRWPRGRAREGDRIVREDGQPYLGAGTYYRALDKRFTFRIIWRLTGQSDEHEPGKLVTD